MKDDKGSAVSFGQEQRQATWGYGAVTASHGSTPVRAGGTTRGMGSLGGMGSISSDNPTVQWFKANFGANLSEHEVNGLITDITRAIQNGLPPEKIPQLTSLPPSAIENLYDTIAAQQGKSANSVRETYEQQRAGDMAALQSLGAAIVVGATGVGAMAGISKSSAQQLAGLGQDALMTIAEEGQNLNRGTHNPGQHVSAAALGQLASPSTPGQHERHRGQGAAMMA